MLLKRTGELSTSSVFFSCHRRYCTLVVFSRLHPICLICCTTVLQTTTLFQASCFSSTFPSRARKIAKDLRDVLLTPVQNERTASKALLVFHLRFPNGEEDNAPNEMMSRQLHAKEDIQAKSDAKNFASAKCRYWNMFPSDRGVKFLLFVVERLMLLLKNISRCGVWNGLLSHGRTRRLLFLACIFALLRPY